MRDRESPLSVVVDMYPPRIFTWKSGKMNQNAIDFS
jgi:hypothetical protein